jgi:hypothetical protein
MMYSFCVRPSHLLATTQAMLSLLAPAQDWRIDGASHEWKRDARGWATLHQVGVRELLNGLI